MSDNLSLLVDVPDAPADAAAARARIAAARRPPATPTTPASSTPADVPPAAPVKRGPGRPRKHPAAPAPATGSAAQAEPAPATPAPETSAAPGGRKKRSGWSSAGGTLRSGDYTKRKADLARERDEAAARAAAAERELADRAARDAAARSMLDGENAAAVRASFGALLGVAFALMAARKGPHWTLTETEKATLGAAGAEAFAPYLGVLGGHLPVLMFGALLWEATSSRVAQDAAAERRRAEGWTVHEPPAPAAAEAEPVVPHMDPATMAHEQAATRALVVAPVHDDVPPARRGL